MAYNPQIHIVIIEDDKALLMMLSNQIKRQGYLVSGFLSGLEGRAYINNQQQIENPVDILVCDVSLPDDDGIEIIQSLRDYQCMGKIFISSSGDTAHRVKGLLAGADDFIPKPVDPQELLLRIEALVKRLPKPKAPHVLAFLHYLYNPETGQLFERNTNSLLSVLGEKEGQLLLHLKGSQGKPVTRKKLAILMNNDEYAESQSKALDILVNRLRKKINDKNKEVIVTLRYQGYMLVSE